jgi:2-oxo-4-hydroxy-4-carboxy-5-ureidoimidazoline decarboxylase
MTQIEIFNTQPEPEAIAALLTCCGSQRWARTLAAQRPFATPQALVEASSALWFSLSEADWLEAFAHHPRIGETRPAITSFLTHSTTEQSTIQQTIAKVAEALIAGNLAYEDKFGFLYIVFASGRTAPELLDVLQSRLRNTREQELHEAATQQDQITTLRIKRWLHI